MKTRLFYLDWLRVVAIACVVLLHAVNPILVTEGYYGSKSWFFSLFFNEISRMGVPLFLMISGCLMLSDERSNDFRFFYRKRLPRLLLPLLVWHTIYYFYYVAVSGSELSMRSFFAQLFNNGSAYHMWFVYSLLGIYLVTPFLKRIVDSCTQKQLGVLLVILLFPGTLRPLWNLSTGFYVFLFDPLMECYLGYFLFGYLLSTLRDSKLLRIGALLGGVCGFLLGYFGNLHACASGSLNYPFNGGYTLNHYLLAGSLFFLVRVLTENRRIPPILSRLTARLSDSSFGVYWIHALVLDLAQHYCLPDASPIVQCGLHFVITIAASILIMLPLAKIKPIKKLFM